MSFDEACNQIVASCPNEYARAYAGAGIGMTGEARRVQALYILSNITHWRGDRAKEVRTALKGYAK